MNQKVSILITAFQRANLLRFGLLSLSLQQVPFELEIIVLNDGIPDETEAVCQEYQEKLNIHYIFTGQRNLDGIQTWRVPGFAYNIGAQNASGDVLLLSCAEMYHFNDTMARIVPPVWEDSHRLAIPLGKDDLDGSFLDAVANGVPLPDPINYCSLNTLLPFFMAISRDQFMAIGGYDEDFSGIFYDDDDLVERLISNGCYYFQTDALVIHLFHPRYPASVLESQEGLYNKNLYLSRKGIILRNQGREWGRL